MEILIYVANILYLLSYFVQDMLRLRVLTVFAATCLVGYFYFQPAPMMTVVCWNLFFIALNIVQIGRILATRRSSSDPVTRAAGAYDDSGRTYFIDPFAKSNMNPFITHPQQQGITYYEHWCFAMGVARRLLSSVVAFVAHALFPFISIESRLDLESTAAFMEERNRWIETAKEKSIGNSSFGFNHDGIGETNSDTDNAPIVV